MKRATGLSALLVVLLGTVCLAAPATAPAEAEEAKIDTITRVYELRDLMMSINDYPFTGRIGAPSDRDVVVVHNQSLDDNKPKTKDEPPSLSARQQRIDDITRLITDIVEADSWRDAGGNVGSIRELSGLLVIQQTPQAHKQIETLLGQLREDHLRTVRVQADWLLLKPSDAKALLAGGGDAKADGGSGAKVVARLVDPAALAKLADGNTHFRGEISCFSGQTVSISSGRTRTAIVDQQPVVAQNAAALGPSVKQIQVGAMLELTPTLESSLQTAVVDVHSEVANWNDAGKAEVAPVQSQTEGGTGPRLGGNTQANIDRLNLVSQSFRTTARVPVGKPVLVGGMTLEPAADEQGESPQLYLILQVVTAR